MNVFITATCLLLIFGNVDGISFARIPLRRSFLLSQNSKALTASLIQNGQDPNDGILVNANYDSRLKSLFREISEQVLKEFSEHNNNSSVVLPALQTRIDEFVDDKFSYIAAIQSLFLNSESTPHAKEILLYRCKRECADLMKSNFDKLILNQKVSTLSTLDEMIKEMVDAGQYSPDVLNNFLVPELINRFKSNSRNIQKGLMQFTIYI